MKRLLLLALFIFMTNFGFAQQTPREEIDQKRQGLWYFDKKAFDMYREFLRIDSSYYVGWLYEGAAKYHRSQDAIGYASAIKPLTKAKTKIQKSEREKLKIRTQDVRDYIGAYQAQQDYCMIMYLLYQCYMNIEEQQKAFEVLNEMKKQKLQKYFFIEPYNSMSWIMHRVRTFSTEQFPFSTGDIENNELKALRFIDTSMFMSRKYYNWNTSIFSADYVNQDFYFNYHNKALIYNYIYELDSAEFYYNLLKETPFFSNNNYAYLCMTKADFKQAEKNYLIEKKQHSPSDKSTKEYNYMLSIINSYKGNPDGELDELIQYTKNMSSLPGFGWNNIALARSYYYAGYYHETLKHIEKAKSFQELHINTSWAPEQYDYAVTLYKYLTAKRRLEQIFFTDKRWWMNLNILMSLPNIFLEKWTNRYHLIGKFGSNPERHYAFYRLFNSECVMSVDEIWSTIEGFNTDYFLEVFSKNLSNDKRPSVYRYYNWVLGNVHLQKKEYDKALEFFQRTLNDPLLNPEYEKLLIARCHEALYKIYSHQKDTEKANFSAVMLSQLYPSLIPFAAIPKKAVLNLQNDHPFLKEVVSELKRSVIDWNDENNEDFSMPELSLSFSDSGGVKNILYQVSLPNGKQHQGNLRGENPRMLGAQLALHTFGIKTEEVEVFDENDYKALAWFAIPLLLLWIGFVIRKRYI